MQVARYYGRGDIRIDELPEPELNPGEVRVRVNVAGICGTDLHEYLAGPIGVPDEEPDPLTGETLPVPMGHECSGVVAETGEGTTIEPDTPVVVNPILWCGDCPYCREGKYHLCERRGAIGRSGKNGAFATSLVVDERQAIPIPETIPRDHAALIEPFTVALRAVREGRLSVGDSVAVLGGGPIGLCLVQIARAAGAGDIVVTEPRESRRAVAEACGATMVVDPTTDDPAETIRELTGTGVDIAFEAAGVESTLSQSIQLTRKDGVAVIVSIFESDVRLNPNALVTGNRTMVGTVGYQSGPLAHVDFERTIGLMEEGEIDPEPLITSRISLDSIVESGFESLAAPDSDDVKILVSP